MRDTKQILQAQQAIEVRSLEELRKLVNDIPEGTVYSIDLKEVIITDGHEEE